MCPSFCLYLPAIREHCSTLPPSMVLLSSVSLLGLISQVDKKWQRGGIMRALARQRWTSSSEKGEDENVWIQTRGRSCCQEERGWESTLHLDAIWPRAIEDIASSNPLNMLCRQTRLCWVDAQCHYLGTVALGEAADTLVVKLGQFCFGYLLEPLK